MTIEKEFPELFQFFAGYFPDADFDNFSDEDVVEQYKADCLKQETGRLHLAMINGELQKLNLHITDYWMDLSDTTNRYFESPIEASDWVQMVRERLNR